MRALLLAITLAGSVSVYPVVIPAFAQDRVDLFDLKGRRTGYAVVDRGSGRVDFYDANSRRTGWGRLVSSGKVERFGLDGRREGETVLPLRPERKGEGR